MSYEIQINRKALKFINKQPQNQKRRILSAIWKLPETGDREPLQGKRNEGLLRLRVGDYRIIYSVDDGRLTVYVVDAGNRGEIYNRY